MAFDVTKPATTDNYLTQFTQGIRANLLALAVGLDSVQSSFTGAVPTYAKRYNRSSKAWEEYNGTSWGLLPFGNIVADSTITGTTLTSYGVGGGGGLLQLRSPGNGSVGARLEMNADSNLYLVNNQSQGIALGTVGVIRTVIDNTGTLYPQATNSYDLGRVSNNWRNIYAKEIRVQNFVSFYAGNGAGHINSNDGNWGMYYRPSVNGTSGCHLWAQADGSGLASLDAAGFFHCAGLVGNLQGLANEATNAGSLRSGGTNTPMRFHWSGQGGQPTWMWGGNNPEDQYVYNPSNFSVAYAATAGNANYANSAGGTIGLGQSWQDVTGSRSINTAYWNTTGRPIMVSVICQGPDGGPILYVDSVRIASTGNPAGTVGNDHNTVCAIVPNNSHYHINMHAQNVNQWLELR